MNYQKPEQIVMICCVLIVIFIPMVSLADTPLFPQQEIQTELQAYGEFPEFAEQLSKNGILLQSDSGYDEIYGLYKAYKDNLQPIFITTDLLLHSVHKLFDYSLRIVETEQFPMLQAFSKEMFAICLSLKKTYENDEILKTPVDQLVMYFAVPAMLSSSLIELDDALKNKVDAEIQLIQAHKGFEFSKILAQKEDYSQYVVRGHYTRTETLKKYFLASMWYGRRMFRFDESKPDGAGEPLDTPDIKGWWNQTGNLPKIAQNEILSACLLVYLLENTTVQGKPAMEIYKALKSPFDLLVGQSEDITVETLSDALRNTFKKGWKPEHLKDIPKVVEMAKQVAKNNIVEIDATGMDRKGLTLLGQRFILDSVFFQRLVHDKENNPMRYTKKGEKGEKPFTWAADQVDGEIRGFPRGLDIMAVLGSETAERLLKVKGDTDYSGYDENLDHAKQRLKGVDPLNNIYEKFLRSFSLLFSPVKDAPRFMQTDIWQKKSLNTALGAWTELRHDTILYGKQSYTSVPRGFAAPDLNMTAYLEPNPELFQRLSVILSDLSSSGMISQPEFLRKYNFFIKILNQLAEISKKELRGELPDKNDTIFLAGLSEQLKHATTLPQELAETIGGEADSQMSLAADVHTRMPLALTEAVGFPAKIIVAIPVKDKIGIFFGGIYTYYEFKVPYDNRLTDEKWTEELKTGKTQHKPLLF